MSSSATKVAAIAAFILVVGAVIPLGIALAGESGVHARYVALASIGPGDHLILPVGPSELSIAVPAGEGATWGTFRVRIGPGDTALEQAAIDQGAVSFDSGDLERDGSLESAWVADINGDTEDDVVIVTRSGGSGSHASIVAFVSDEHRFVMRRVPGDSPTPGFMGHDTVTVEDGRIVRSFATYVDREELRLDRQWRLRDVADGEWPIKTEGDSNARPSGATVSEWFDLTVGRWCVVGR